MIIGDTELFSEYLLTINAATGVLRDTHFDLSGIEMVWRIERDYFGGAIRSAVRVVELPAQRKAHAVARRIFCRGSYRTATLIYRHDVLRADVFCDKDRGNAASRPNIEKIDASLDVGNSRPNVFSHEFPEHALLLVQNRHHIIACFYSFAIYWINQQADASETHFVVEH